VSAFSSLCEFGGDAQLRETALSGYVEGVPATVIAWCFRSADRFGQQRPVFG